MTGRTLYTLLVAIALALASVAVAAAAPLEQAQPYTGTLTAEAIVTVSALVVGLTQLVKWLGLPDRRGAIVVVLLALLGVVAYQVSYAPDGKLFQRTDLWPILAAWIAVATSAAGVFGFTRAAADAVTATRSPPPGAAQQPVEKV